MTRARLSWCAAVAALALAAATPASAQTQVTSITQPASNPIWSSTGPHTTVFNWTGGHSAVVVKCIGTSTQTEYSGESFGARSTSPATLNLTGFGAGAPAGMTTQCKLRIELIGTMGEVLDTKEVDVRIQKP
jgi:hypothetical protein